MSNSPPAIPPWGGRTPYLGTNPIAVGVPRSPDPIVIAVALSVTARGKVLLAAKEGRPIPPDWAIDAEGRPTTDPRAALGGALLPMGGHKGYALALAVEVLAAVLTGAAFGVHVPDHFALPGVPADLGHCFLALDAGRILPLGEFSRRLGQLAAEVHGVPPVPGGEGPRLPGEGGAAGAARARQQGLRLPAEVVSELKDLADVLDVPFPAEALTPA